MALFTSSSAFVSNENKLTQVAELSCYTKGCKAPKAMGDYNSHKQ